MSRSRMSSINTRRFVASVTALIIAVSGVAYEYYSQSQVSIPESNLARQPIAESATAAGLLQELQTKGRAPKTGYERAKFGAGWQEDGSGCSTRNTILKRDLREIIVDERCRVTSGLLHDPYTGKEINFMRGQLTSDDVQIDHVVALSNAWQTGAQQISAEHRVALANDPLNLLAVDGLVNQQKSDADAATWLPPSKEFRCSYVARQISVKYRYHLWVTPAERDAMQRVLGECPQQKAISEG